MTRIAQESPGAIGRDRIAAIETVHNLAGAEAIWRGLEASQSCTPFQRFDFVDATNLSSPQAPHVYGVELRFVDPDHFVLTFLFVAGAQRSREQLTLARVQTR